ncbi:MAG TPA: ABC transporter ATP-binding protein [Rhodoblastus sp.]|nr:ABC transporter ATP-binding protein [Rhodoblastus sp.]
MTEYNGQVSRSAQVGAPVPTGDAPAGGVMLSVRMPLHGPAGPFDLDVNLSVAKGAFVALVGPSGAGKTTLLRLLAGLTHPAHGRISVGSSIWCDTATGKAAPVRDRPIGFVFQDYALFPNMTVAGNVEYAVGRGFDPGEIRRLLELVDLQALAGAYPARLSGGQKQRLALIRALARRPEILMLDEPLSALDPAMRRQLQDELKRLHKTFGTTTFLVSHDVTEILRLADRVVRLENGKVISDGDAASIFALEGKGLLAHHVSGPDEDGVAVVSIDGRLCRVRYRNPPPGVSAGDLVTLDIDDASVRLVGAGTPSGQAGTIVTFTSRGGAR